MNLFQKAMHMLDPMVQPSNGSALSFVLTDHFRGYKKLPVVVHGDSEAERNNKKMAKEDMPGRTIKFVPGTYGSGNKSYYVFLDNMKMGTVYDEDNIKRVKNIKEVYARMDEEAILGKHTMEKRTRIHLFIKES